MRVPHSGVFDISTSSSSVTVAGRETSETMTTPVAMLAPGHQTDPPTSPAMVKDQEPRCCSLKRCAIAIGISQIIMYSIGIATASILVLPGFGAQSYIIMPLAVFVHIALNSMLIHGARTNCRCLVLSWVGYHSARLVLVVVGIHQFIVLIVNSNSDFRILTGMFAAAAILLFIIEGGFLAVGIALSRRLSDRKGVVIQGQQLGPVVVCEDTHIGYSGSAIAPPPPYEEVQHPPQQLQSAYHHQ